MQPEIKHILKRYLQIIPLVTLISGVLAYTLNVFLYPEGADEPLKTFGSAFVFTTVFTLFLVPAFQILDHYFPLSNVYEVALHIAVQIAVSIGCYFLAFYINDSLFHIGAEMTGQDRFINFIFTMMITMIVIVTFYIQMFISRNREAREKAIQSELSALRAQVNPHFLFNSLNSIASLVRTHPDQAERVTEDLAELFRYSLDSSKKHMVTIQKEIEAAKTYFMIEKARFGDDIQFNVNREPGVGGKDVPALIIQPLVENSVKHGFQQTGGPFSIDLDVTNVNGLIMIEIKDTGPGFGNLDSEEIFKRGTGLSNIRDRLQLHYGGRAAIKPEGNSVKITIPSD